MEKVCPCCGRPEASASMCQACTATLRYELRDVPAVVADLDVTLSRQARLERGKAGLASERSGYNENASDPGWVLGNVLGTWARDVCGEDAAPPGTGPPAVVAAHLLLSEMDAIRRHPAADELVDEVLDAIRLARRVTDRPANRTTFPVGPCPEDTDDGPCPGEVVAFIPTEDERPSWLRCQAEEAHRWSSIQFYRVGERIRRRMEQRRGRGAA